MSGRGLRWAVGVAGIALGVALAVLLAVGGTFESTAATIVVSALLIGWSFLGTGLFAWRRRPGNRVGPLMVGVAVAWMLAALDTSKLALPFSIGYLVSALPFAPVVHLLLAYPTGRLESPLARVVVTLAYVDVSLGSLLVSAFLAHDPDALDAPRNVLLLADEPGLGEALLDVVTLSGVALVVAAGFLLLRRWSRANGLERRALAPLLWTGALFLAFLALTLAADQLTSSDALKDVCGGLASILFLAVPFAYLAGLLGSGYSRAHAVGALVGRLTEAGTRQSVRDAMAESLGDPELELLFRRHDREEWVDAQGCRIEPPAHRPLTEISRDGAPIAAIVHDAVLGEDPELLQSIGAAAALALENERLEAELRARVTELKESRANIIAFGMSERRRLERDLHDGAQQRLVALSLQVNLARAKLEDDPATAATLLDGARQELRQALDELRELARGIHPAILTDHGLHAAVSALADRSPVPVDLQPLPAQRLPAHVEAVAYFVVAESLTNVAKYAQAREASVSVARQAGKVVVEVRDDGVGGADIARGSGLRGLADRVAALEGHLEIVSPTDAGTLVRAVIPCASS